MYSPTLSFNRPSNLRLTTGLLAVMASATLCAQAATEEVSMKLGGKQFGHKKSLAVSSGPKKIAKSKFYSYKISGTIRGKGGVLGGAYKKEMPLDKFLDSLQAGTSSLLQGSLENPTGDLPATLVDKSIKGSRNIKVNGKKMRVKLNLKLTGKIATDGQIALEIARVKVMANGSPLDGVMVFGKGSALEVSTAPVVEFKGTGQPAFSEGSGSASVIVRRLGNKAVAASVQFATADGTAMDGEDYTSTSGTVDFAAGEIEKTITIPLIDNSIKDRTRKFTVILSSPGTGTVLGAKTTNTVTIADND